MSLEMSAGCGRNWVSWWDEGIRLRGVPGEILQDARSPFRDHEIFGHFGDLSGRVV